MSLSQVKPLKGCRGLKMEVDELTHYQIPRKVIELVKGRGIRTLYPPQEDAVKSGVLEGYNFVLAIPTAAGKTLVAELALLKKVLEGRGKALYLVPLRALASEKYEQFKEFERLGVRVAISTGDYDSADTWLETYDVIVCTNEKADSLLRHRSRWMGDVAIVVADEIHLINDASRGPTLEVVLARLRQVNPKAQILALSATIRNADEIAEWLKARLVASDWRPVPLMEGVYLKDRVVFKEGDIVKIGSAYPDASVNIATDIVRGGGQALIFTSTRPASMRLAKKLEEPIGNLLKGVERDRLGKVAEEILRQGEVTRISRRLAEGVAHGVAFHHAGLHHAHRRIVEDAFRGFSLKVICATPTLAAGVNLPARRVVVYDYRRYEHGLGYYPISILEYKQMAGRAGRPQYDRVGEAILIAKTNDEKEFLLSNYVLSPPERIWSKLAAEPALRSHILAAIATDYAHSEKGLMEFIKNTFYAHQYEPQGVLNIMKRIISFLEGEGMVEAGGGMLTATAFGKRVAQLYIDPLSASMLRNGLSKKKPTTIIGYLHLVCRTPDMPKLYLRRGNRKPLDNFVKAHGKEFLIELPDEALDPEGYEFLLAEVKTSLLLQEWIEEVSEDALIEHFDVGSGDIYAFVETARWLLYSSYEIAKLFKFKQRLGDLNILQQRVDSGVKAELLPLVQLRGVGRVRARALFDAGYKTIEDLRKVSLQELLKIFTIGPETAKSIKEQVAKL